MSEIKPIGASPNSQIDKERVLNLKTGDDSWAEDAAMTATSVIGYTCAAALPAIHGSVIAGKFPDTLSWSERDGYEKAGLTLAHTSAGVASAISFGIVGSIPFFKDDPEISQTLFETAWYSFAAGSIGFGLGYFLALPGDNQGNLGPSITASGTLSFGLAMVLVGELLIFTDDETDTTVAVTPNIGANDFSANVLIKF